MKKTGLVSILIAISLLLASCGKAEPAVAEPPVATEAEATPEPDVIPSEGSAAASTVIPSEGSAAASTVIPSEGSAAASTVIPSEGSAATGVEGSSPTETPATPTVIPSEVGGSSPTETPAATPTAAPTAAQSPAAPSASGSTPFAQHGALSFSGTRMVDAHGNNYQLKGVSTHGIAWFPEYVNKEAFKTIRDEWGGNCIRLAMYSAEGAGYCTGADKTWVKGLVTKGVDHATELGMYVIIDWHVLGEHDPNVYKDEAKKFFDEMSRKYAAYDNVLYEICNEPNGGTDWSSVKRYAEEVIPVIRANDPNAIIIVGTPTWSQDVDRAAQDPIKGYSNICYTIHFYAATHKDYLRQKMNTALNAGLPLFCSEFGTCDASGNGGNDFGEADKWIAAMDRAGVSYCIWNLSNKNESSSLIRSSCNKLAGWTQAELSDEGQWYVSVLGGGRNLGSTEQPQDNGSNGNNNNNDNNNGNNNNNNGGGNTVSSSADNTSAEVSADNSWNSGSADCTQFTLRVKATGNDNVERWKVKLEFDRDIKLDQFWNGNFVVSGRTMTITGVDFNSIINAGGNAEVGFIVSSSGKANVTGVNIQ